MEDMLELTKKSCELTIFSNSKSNTRRIEGGDKELEVMHSLSCKRLEVEYCMTLTFQNSR